MRMFSRSLVPAVTFLSLVFLAGRAPAEEVGPKAVEDETADRQTPVVEEEIVVSATRVEVPRRRVGSAVTVIPREEIERRREVTVAEILRSVPGVEVVRTGGPGGATSVFIRGANSSHTLVLLDGVRVNSSLGGSLDWADLTPDLVERIEVLRGPQSALYGSEAIGGVVNIVTRKGRDAALVRAGIEKGTHDAYRLWATAGAGGEIWDWSVGASQQETDGVSRAGETAGNSESDPWRNVTVAGSLGRSLQESGTALLSVRYIDATTSLDGFDFFSGPVDDPNFTQDREAAVASFAVELPLTSRWTQKVRLGFADETLETRDPDSEPLFHNSSLSSTTADIGLQADVTISEHNSFSVGTTYEKRDGSRRGDFSESVDVFSGYLENRFDWNETLFVTAGVRHDNHSVFGGKTTWRVTGSRLLARTKTRLHGTWGTGFKAPTFVDLYFPFFGNPDLDPERSESFDLGIEQQALDGDLVFDLTWFSSEVDDLIVFDFATFLAANVAEAKIDGLEAQITWKPGPSFEARASYTRTDSEDVTTGAPLARRPKHRGVVSLTFAPLPRFEGVVSLFAVRDRFDVGGVPLDDYERLDATLDYQLGERWGTYLRARNLLDEDYEEVLGFTSPGAQVVVGLRLGS